MPMSNKNTAHKLPRKPTDAARAIREDARYGVSFLRSHWKRLLLLFAGIALGGSALLNLGAKQLFARERPSLWESIHPETTFSFPSGHAMGSMTLAAVLVLLAWRTRWRWWVAVPALAFALLVGASRVYLGVHFPSDILAGWAAACAWVVLAYLLVFHGTRPWRNGVAD